MVYDDKSVYEGFWLNDKRSSVGRLKYPNLDEVEGDWVDDKLNGQGKLVFADGSVYIGEFANNII